MNPSNPHRRTHLRASAAWLLTATATCIAPTPAHSMNTTQLPPVGRSTLRFLGLSIYDAQLNAAAGFAADRYDKHPLALTLTYARKLEGKLIAERSLIEMRRVGDVPPAQAEGWMDFMVKAFPDVGAGDKLTGTHDGQGKVQFLFNDVVRASTQDATFARLFFGIWLHPNTSQPVLRKELLGLKG